MRTLLSLLSAILGIAAECLFYAGAARAQGQIAWEERPQVRAAQRIANVLSDIGDPNSVDGLFARNARLFIQQETALTTSSLRSALQARECGGIGFLRSRDEAAVMIAVERADALDAIQALTDPVLVVQCNGNRPAAYELYGLDFEGAVIRRIRLVSVVPIPPPVIIPTRYGPPRPVLPPSETLPARFAVVAGYITALYRGDLDRSGLYLADDVEVAVADGTRTTQTFPPGKGPARAMILAMADRGALAVEDFSCRPEGERALCEFLFGRGERIRRFTLRFEVRNGRITRILSWENH